MRILQITSHLNVGGITRYVLSLSKRLTQRGHEVTVAADGGQLAAQLGTMGVKQWQFLLNTSQEFGPRVFWGIQGLVARLRQDPVDVIHAHTRVAQVVADQVSRRLNIPYVTTWHGIYKPRLGRRLYPCTGKICIAISSIVRQHLIRDFQIPPQHIRLVHNGIDTEYYAVTPDSASVEAYREKWGILKSQPVMGGIGRLAAGEVKGFDVFLAAACLLEESVPGIQVLIVGDGPRRPFLEDVAGRLGIRNRVHFAGKIEDIRIPLALMDLFIFPSRWSEAFGLTLVEAMSAGKPVIATQVGAVPEIVQHGVNGWLVPPDDPAFLAESVERLLSDQAAARELGQQAQMRAREAFGLERMVTEVERVYTEVQAT